MNDFEKQRIQAHEKLTQVGQEHVLRFWPQLSPAEKENLLKQIEDLDYGYFAAIKNISFTAKSAKRSLDDLKPFPVISLARSEEERNRFEIARQKGEQLLQSGKIGIILVAGGQGTRLGYDGPKGTIPVGPVTSRSLFQYHLEKMIAMERRYRITLPLYIMTSTWNHAQTRTYFEEHDYFGKDPATVTFFKQRMLPVLDQDKKILLQDAHTISLAPDGHGGLVNAIDKYNLIEDMKQRGLEFLFYFQVDNVLVKICDPTFIGFHAQAEAEMSAKTVYKSHPDERLGVMGLLSGKPVVIEYTEMPRELKEKQNEKGVLIFGQGSIAIHMFAVSFFDRLIQEGVALPYHVAHKQVDYIDAEGKTQRPSEPNAYKLEQFIFDALPYARRVMAMETERSVDFSPIKNAEGEDSLDTARHDLCELFAGWLEENRLKVARDADGKLTQKIEISPLYALNPSDLAGKVTQDMLGTGDILL
ncbi:UDPGP type 1 family protein [candidate division KSB1 bacterium]|nr:UDPGP type 1 family protein [candidate division KSB1 bacterium]